MSCDSLSGKLNHFISTVNTLELDGHGKYLYADTIHGKICHVTDKTSTLAEINDVVTQLLAQEKSDITLKQWGKFRAAFSCVINNYEGDPATDIALNILNTIPRKNKLLFGHAVKKNYNIYDSYSVIKKLDEHPVTLRTEERNARQYKMQALEAPQIDKLNDQTSIGILKIINTIKNAYCSWTDYNGMYVLAVVTEALAATEDALKDNFTGDALDFCNKWVKESIDGLNGSEDIFDPVDFQLANDNGWLLNTPENRKFLAESENGTWQKSELRTAKVYFPEKYEEHFEIIFSNDDVERAMQTFFESIQKDPLEVTETDKE